MIAQHDIKILDVIIDKILESKYEIAYKHFDDNEFFEGLSDNEFKLEFQRLIDHIERYNCAKIIVYGYFNSLVANQNTKSFKENGGFAAIYKNQLLDIEKQKKKDKQEAIEHTTSMWKYYTYWPLFAITVISCFIAIQEFRKNQENEESIKILIQKIEQKELERP